MPGELTTNPYSGIDAHLNSYLQQPEGGWRSFHNAHIIDLGRAINRLLPDNYYALTEQSLQIATYDTTTDIILGKTTTTPDVTVYQRRTGSGLAPAAAQTNSPTSTLPLPITIVEEKINSVVIYRLEDDPHRGRPVTRLELLSPANKPPGSHYNAYIAKRSETLLAGLRLIEIDYLHERRPTRPDLPSYIDRDNGAYPYYVLISDPRPDFRQGATQVYGFSVDSPLPVVPVPLAGPELIHLDLNAVYNFTLENERGLQRLPDYTRDPVNMHTYTDEDQVRIRQRMAEITGTQTG